MQTFLPYPDFAESARCLDDKRLGNQFYREGLTLLRGKWLNHPASKMWRGHRYALALYLLACGLELQRRGRDYPNHLEEVQDAIAHELLAGNVRMSPKWLGDPDFHAAHRSNLLRKDPEWYEQFGWAEPADLPYIWPTNED